MPDSSFEKTAFGGIRSLGSFHPALIRRIDFLPFKVLYVICEVGMHYAAAAGNLLAACQRSHIVTAVHQIVNRSNAVSFLRVNGLSVDGHRGAAACSGIKHGLHARPSHPSHP